MANPSKSQGKESSKKEKVADSLRDELELVSAATSELQKLRRQLRQTRTDLSASKIANRKTIQRQTKGIELLEKEKADCLGKLSVIKDAQKPPQAIHKLIAKYHHALYQLENVRRELQSARQALKERDNLRMSRNQPITTEPIVKPSQDRLDQVVLQYNKILAKNTQLRSQLEEMMKIKEEFMRSMRQLQNERNQIRSAVDRLYEENTGLFQQREEFRLKLNLLRERLETTRIQGARDLNEYRRLLNNDEKLNAFLEQKNQERPCLELVSRVSAQQVGDDQMAQKLVDEWRETLTAQIGHCNFEEIVQQYQHNLEQGYVLYGLIAQKNNEIDRLEDEINELEQKIDQQRSKSHPQLEIQEDNNSASAQGLGKQLELESVIRFIARFQEILDCMDVKIQLINDTNFSVPLEFSRIMELFQLGCENLAERVLQLVATISENTNRNYSNMPIMSASSQSSNSSFDEAPTAE